MCNNRNATASWSGYSHQGKVGLYVALRKLNELCSPDSIKHYEIQFEQLEDFAIFNKMIAKEIHQVKALIGKPHKSQYKKAIDGKILDACENGPNYLHVITPIIDWNTSKTLTHPNIYLYTYHNNKTYCELENINYLIFEQITDYLEKINHPQKDVDGWKNLIIESLLSHLDNKILDAHIYERTIRITFVELSKLLESNEKFCATIIHGLRQAYYNGYIAFIQMLNTSEEIITEHEKNIFENCIKKIYLLNDDDFLSFLRNLNPHLKKIYSRDLSAETITDIFQASIFKQLFFYCIVKIHKTPFQLNKLLLQYSKNNEHFVHTLVSIEEFEAPQNSVNILKNYSYNDRLFDNSHLINRFLDKKLSYYAEKITETPSNNKKNENDKFYKRKNLKYISRDNVISLLNKK